MAKLFRMDNNNNIKVYIIQFNYTWRNFKRRKILNQEYWSKDDIKTFIKNFYN